MTRDTNVNLPWTAIVAAGAVLLAVGAGGAYLVLRSGGPAPGREGSATTAVATPAADAAAPFAGAPSGSLLPDVVVTLSQDAIGRAGIAVTPVGAGGAPTGLRLPGIVEPNAYAQVSVTPLVAGRITRALVQLGERVRKDQTMAEIFSPEMAEAHTRYTSARAELEAHERELQRTEKLVELGAASRQELERLHAEHTAKVAEVQSARSRLELLGVPPATLDAVASGQLDTSINVPAPISGVVTERLANVGLNVDTASKLFTITDLSTVWVVADLYEKDFSRVSIGSAATITTSAYPDRPLQGRVSYIDPQVNAQTRTAKVRVEVPNARNELRLGMYADVTIAGAGSTGVAVIPRNAVQNVGDRQVVYLANQTEPGKFTEREVRLGQPSGDQIEVLSGVTAGDRVVTKGSFFLRAERERLGLRAP